MAKVGIVMGSDSDMPVMAKAADVLEQLGVDYEMTIISAHREPDVFFDYANSWDVRGDFPDACHWHSDAYDVFGRAGFPVFDCADAVRDSGRDCRH